MKIEIKHRYTGAVLFTTEVDDGTTNPVLVALMRAIFAGQSAETLTRLNDEASAAIKDTVLDDTEDEERAQLQLRLDAIERELASPSARANLARANLAGADLAGAYLADADLAGADLAGANLAGADLAGAYLADADLARADLAGANLAGANLAGANLAGADLAGADLAGANLADANLARADLAGANLAGANLAGANLAGANLAGADLAGANLADANLAGANLAGAYLADAYLARAYLARAYLADARNLPSGIEAKDPEIPYVQVVAQPLAERAARYRERNPEIPVVEAIDAKILAAITSGGGTLRMASWHTCDTTHCRGGWAVNLAGEAGRELERKIGTPRAAAAIYMASTGRVPHFYATDERALEDIKQCAAAQTGGGK